MGRICAGSTSVCLETSTLFELFDVASWEYSWRPRHGRNFDASKLMSSVGVDERVRTEREIPQNLEITELPPLIKLKY